MHRVHTRSLFQPENRPKIARVDELAAVSESKPRVRKGTCRIRGRARFQGITGALGGGQDLPSCIG